MNQVYSLKAQEIIDHTRILLESGGYNSFSYADISERVNIRKASIHHHFPSKLELVKVVVAMYREEAREGLEGLTHRYENAEEALRAYLNYWAHCIQNGSSAICICALLAMELPSIPEEVAAQVRSHFKYLVDWVSEILQRGIEQNLFNVELDLATEANILVATVHGAMLSARATGQPELFQSIVQQHLKKLLL